MLAVHDDSSELRLLGTSPVLSKDYFSSGIAEYCPPSYYDDDIAAEVNITCGAGFDDRNFLYSDSTYTNTSCGTSVTSDFSEDSYFDDDQDLFNDSDDTSLEYRSVGTTSNNDSSSTSQTLQSVFEEDPSDIEDTEMITFNEHGQCSSSTKSRKSKSNKKNSECSCCELRKRMVGLSWSKMSSEDQLQSIEYLTRVVSTTLGLREQLDIIRIISPDATVSSQDTEFFIDLDTFNDDKFQQLKLYVSEQISSNNCKKCLESRQNRGLSKRSHPKYSKRKAPKPLTTKPVSKKSRKSKGLLSRIHRQVEKEKRSGLFSKEEVVSLSRKTSISECEEDIEVDILC